MTQNTGSDLSIAEDNSVGVVFLCDGESVSCSLRIHNHLEQPIKLSRAEAVEIGRRILETGSFEGLFEDVPLQLSTNQVKNFGTRLMQYGESGR